MQKFLLASLFTLIAATSQAAVFQCHDDPTPTPKCQYGTHFCSGHGWCGPYCETQTCLNPGPQKPLFQTSMN